MSNSSMLEQAAQVATIIYTVFTFFIMLAAFKALNAWKTQKKSDRAESIITHAYELKQLIERARAAIPNLSTLSDDQISNTTETGMKRLFAKPYKIFLADKDLTAKTPLLILLSKHYFPDAFSEIEKNFRGCPR